MPEITRVHGENYDIYGAHKAWKQLNRERIEVGRDRVARLMRTLGLVGVRRGKFRRTTISDATVDRPSDLVDRQFAATGPNRLWVADIERHEALPNPAVAKGHRLWLVAASR